MGGGGGGGQRAVWLVVPTCLKTSTSTSRARHPGCIHEHILEKAENLDKYLNIMSRFVFVFFVLMAWLKSMCGWEGGVLEWVYM